MGVVWVLMIPASWPLFSGTLFKIPGVLTWAWLFLTSKVIEAVRGQKYPCEAKKKHEGVE